MHGRGSANVDRPAENGGSSTRSTRSAQCGQIPEEETGRHPSNTHDQVHDALQSPGRLAVWLAPSRIKVDELRKILTEHKVIFQPGDKRERLLPLYKDLRLRHRQSQDVGRDVGTDARNSTVGPRRKRPSDAKLPARKRARKAISGGVPSTTATAVAGDAQCSRTALPSTVAEGSSAKNVQPGVNLPSQVTSAGPQAPPRGTIWLAPSRIKVTELRKVLEEHNVPFAPGDKKERLLALYKPLKLQHSKASSRSTQLGGLGVALEIATENSNVGSRRKTREEEELPPGKRPRTTPNPPSGAMPLTTAVEEGKHSMENSDTTPPSTGAEGSSAAALQPDSSTHTKSSSVGPQTTSRETNLSELHPGPSEEEIDQHPDALGAHADPPESNSPTRRREKQRMEVAPEDSAQPGLQAELPASAPSSQVPGTLETPPETNQIAPGHHEKRRAMSADNFTSQATPGIIRSPSDGLNALIHPSGIIQHDDAFPRKKPRMDPSGTTLALLPPGKRWRRNRKAILPPRENQVLAINHLAAEQSTGNSSDTGCFTGQFTFSAPLELDVVPGRPGIRSGPACIPAPNDQAPSFVSTFSDLGYAEVPLPADHLPAPAPLPESTAPTLQTLADGQAGQADCSRPSCITFQPLNSAEGDPSAKVGTPRISTTNNQGTSLVCAISEQWDDSNILSGVLPATSAPPAEHADLLTSVDQPPTLAGATREPRNPLLPLPAALPTPLTPPTHSANLPVPVDEQTPLFDILVPEPDPSISREMLGLDFALDEHTLESSPTCLPKPADQAITLSPSFHRDDYSTRPNSAEDAVELLNQGDRAWRGYRQLH
ncbi:uncharacterized protein PGTG_13515 [Puccinia graminis f. sp. tritici CRL 75-36-700-3]|uniref:Uncharacterized protein n=1 Tax=Puccinia graminis f. sp. tritici (strain CRL 75-36-700-3 / race SCCL) TaxID=418459 RepID=E3KTM2_PUCGT|nr:uncharacterized protein PGTG_13515 [Puccinia graminis f. sp. tritici CRL 75-36-700-3]EFP87729.1 hypothetical protein PGTG_13515 [Puccinia graminis f. sp. tritici CRL 75-36-700-3]